MTRTKTTLPARASLQYKRLCSAKQGFEICSSFDVRLPRLPDSQCVTQDSVGLPPFNHEAEMPVLWELRGLSSRRIEAFLRPLIHRGVRLVGHC